MRSCMIYCEENNRRSARAQERERYKRKLQSLLHAIDCCHADMEVCARKAVAKSEQCEWIILPCARTTNAVKSIWFIGQLISCSILAWRRNGTTKVHWMNWLRKERRTRTIEREEGKMQIILKVLFIFISNFLCSKKMNGIPFRITTTGAVI